MTSVTIGEKQLAVSRPADLEDKLVATTGCSSGELADMLRRVAAPATIALALHPLLDQPMPLAELADLIETADLGALAGSVAAALAPPVAAPAAPVAYGA